MSVIGGGIAAAGHLRWRPTPPAVAMVLAAAMTASPAGAETKPNDPIKVVVTIKPVHGLVARVMEGVGTPKLLVSGAASPHTYALKPSDARALNGADVFFRVSEAVEPFTGKIFKSLPKSVRTVTLAEVEGVEQLDKRAGETFEAHAHAGHGEHGHKAAKAGRGHDHEEGHNEHGKDEVGTSRDGHVWLDPRNAKAMVAGIVETLAAASPKDADKLKANGAKLTADLDALEAEIAKSLEPAKSRPFVVFHDAYQYFERRFGLNAVGSITVSPEVKPSAKRLTEVRKKISGLEAACVFAEPNFAPSLVSTVTEGTGAKAGTLDPEGATIKEGPNAYFELMRGLAAGLKGCLHQGS